MKRLENKVAIITGAAGGIGSAAAALFLSEGARVLLVDCAEERLQKTTQALNSEHVSYAVADVSQVEDTQRYIHQAVERFGGVDVLLANAGTVGVVKDITQYPVEDFDRLISVNLRGVWLGMKYVFPEMQKRGGGSIVLTSSIAGVTGFANLGPYSASKHALLGLVRSVAQEGAPSGIRVNAVCPGVVDDHMMRLVESSLAPGASDQAKAMFSNRVPLKRYATTEDIARMMLFLASDESSYVTGSAHLVDGGITAGVM